MDYKEKNSMNSNKVYRNEKINFKNENIIKDELYYIATISFGNFTQIKDVYGLSTSNKMISKLIKNISDTLNEKEAVTQYYSDEIVLGIYAKDDDSVKEKLENILGILDSNAIILNKKLKLNSICGVSVFRNRDVLEDVIEKARQAKFRASSISYEKIFFFDESVSLEIEEDKRIKKALHKSIENDELYLLYQPIVDISQKVIIGYEAFLRWNNPKFSSVPIDKVIKIAEESNCIIEIGEWVFNEASRMLKRLHEKNISIFMSINISPSQLIHNDFLDLARNTIEKYDLPPSKLNIEITEKSLVKDTVEKRNILTKIKEMGLSISIDDFAIEYSSLNYLSELKADTIKIDKLFIENIVNDYDARMLYQYIMSIGQSLNLSVISEGVETEEQVKLLRSMGCKNMQGYFIGKPISLEDN